jgi:membrane-bound serine protease (ClpP class)
MYCNSDSPLRQSKDHLWGVGCFARLAGWLLVALWGSLFAGQAVQAQSPEQRVHVVQIDGIIDLGLAPLVRRVIAEAEKTGASAVILDINTFGGRVDAAVQIRDALLSAKIPTVAFVNKRAISAGALISLAAEKIVMGGGATMGAAAPVLAGQPGAEQRPVSEKTVSYVRKEFRATAEARKRPPALAEAMVDADVEIAGVSEKGKLLTLTTEEALRLKLIDLKAETLQDLLQELGLAQAQVIRHTTNWAEEVVRFLTNPVVASLLMTIAMVGILIELRTPGFGLPGMAGLGSLGLFLWGHSIVQLVGWEELIVLLLGLLLLGAELIFIPGFGIAGVLGISAILVSLVMSLLGEGAAPTMILTTIGQVGLSLMFAMVVMAFFLRALPRLSIGRALVLRTELSTDKGFASAPESDSHWLGKTGRAITPLHPAGIADIEGHRVDVVSEGEPIDAEQVITVVRVDGNRVVVRHNQ